MKKLFLSILGLTIVVSLQAQTNVARNAVYVQSDITDGGIRVPTIYDGNYSDNPNNALIVNESVSSKYFILDLQKSYAITSINFYFGSYYPSTYAVYNSMDGYTNPICTGSVSSGTITITTFTFPYNINSSRYLKVVLTGSGGTVHFSLTEFEVYANQTYISFTYDLAGNRTKRELKTITLKSAKVVNKNSAITDTIPQDKFADELTDHKINLFPVPTKGQLNIEITNLKPDESATVFVFDINGKQVKYINNMQSGTIDFSNNPNGIYILRIFIGKDKTEWKIVKE